MVPSSLAVFRWRYIPGPKPWNLLVTEIRDQIQRRVFKKNERQLHTMEDTITRQSWDAYFMTITRQVAGRSTCTRAKVGAVIVRERNILTTGYNGAPAGMPHCTEVGCLIYKSTTPTGEPEDNCYRTIHAEINAIAQAAKNGTNIRGANIYVTHTPCIHCLKVLINTGIKTIYYEKPYKIHTVQELLKYSKVELRPIEMHS